MSKRDKLELRVIGLVMAVVVAVGLLALDFWEFWNAGN